MKSLQIQNKVVPLHSQSGNNESTFKKTGALVQLVWLEYMPVTHGVTGSSPVRTASLQSKIRKSSDSQ